MGAAGIAGALFAGCAADRPQPDHLRAIRAANDRMEACYESGDYGALAAMYEDDAILLGPDGYRVSGREALDAYWAPDPGRPVPTERDWELSIERLEGEGSLLIQRGTSRLGRVVNGERRLSVVGFYVIWRGQPDGSYRIAVDAYWPIGE